MKFNPKMYPKPGLVRKNYYKEKTPQPLISSTGLVGSGP